MSLPFLFQLATGDQQGRSQPEKGCANDPSEGAHPSRVPPAFEQQPRGAPDSAGYAAILRLDAWMDSFGRAEFVQRGVGCNDGAVGTGHLGGQEAPVGPEIGAWLAEAMPSVTQLFAAAHQVTGVLFLGAQATSAAGDKVAVAAGNACAWLADHPRPDTAIGEQFEAAFDEFVDLAERSAIAARAIADRRGFRHHDLDGRAARATADLMIAMYATSRDDE